jgi:hypothetical protein
MSDAPKPAAGWYPDEEMVGTIRYWDGSEWTDHRAPAGSQPVTSAVTVVNTEPRSKRPFLIAGVIVLLLTVVVGGFALKRGMDNSIAAGREAADARTVSPSEMAAVGEAFESMESETEVDSGSTKSGMEMAQFVLDGDNCSMAKNFYAIDGNEDSYVVTMSGIIADVAGGTASEYTEFVSETFRECNNLSVPAAGGNGNETASLDFIKAQDLLESLGCSDTELLAASQDAFDTYVEITTKKLATAAGGQPSEWNSLVFEHITNCL